MCVLKTVYQTEASALRNIVRHQIVTAHAGDVDGSGSAFGQVYPFFPVHIVDEFRAIHLGGIVQVVVMVEQQVFAEKSECASGGALHARAESACTCITAPRAAFPASKNRSTGSIFILSASPLKSGSPGTACITYHAPRSFFRMPVCEYLPSLSAASTMRLVNPVPLLNTMSPSLNNSWGRCRPSLGGLSLQALRKSRENRLIANGVIWVLFFIRYKYNKKGNIC